jgi:hypothetical protein
MTPLPLPVTRAWARASRAFDQRALRERVLLTLGAAVLLIWLIDLRWIDSRRLHLQALRQQFTGASTSQARLQADALQLQQLIQARRQQGQADIDTLRRQLAQAAPLFAGDGAQAAATAEPRSPGGVAVSTSSAPPGQAMVTATTPGIRPDGTPTRAPSGQPGTSSVTPTLGDGAALAESALPGLVTPQQMLPLLDELLGRQHGLRLRSLQVQGRTHLSGTNGTTARSAPAVGTTQLGTSVTQAAGVTAPGGNAGAATTLPLYRHGVALSVEGSYGDLLAYLQALEALPHKLLWGPLTLDVEHHPQVLLKLEVYTLSLQAEWVEL